MPISGSELPYPRSKRTTSAMISRTTSVGESTQLACAGEVFASMLTARTHRIKLFTACLLLWNLFKKKRTKDGGKNKPPRKPKKKQNRPSPGRAVFDWRQHGHEC